MGKTMTGGHPDLKMVNPCAAAIDIGSTMHMAAVNPDSTDLPVRAFGTFTRDLHDLADWFRSCGVTSVAMESTAVDSRAERPMSAMLGGCDSCIPTACCVAVSGLRPRLPLCAPTCGNVNG